MKWPSEMLHVKIKLVLLGDVRTVWTAEGSVRLGDRSRQLQQRATGVEQQPAVRRWTPLAPATAPRGCADTPHAGGGGEGTSEGGRRMPPEEEEGAACRRGGHLDEDKGVRRPKRASRISKYGKKRARGTLVRTKYRSRNAGGDEVR